MSELISFLERLDGLDIKLSVSEDKLRINAPKGSLTAALRDELRAHKSALLSFLSQPGAAAAANIPRAPREGALPTTLGQERLWFLDQLEGQSSAYNLFGTYSLYGQLDRHCLTRALGEIIARHEILRTRFPEQDGHPVQHIEPAETAVVPLAYHDFRDRENGEIEARRLLRGQALAPFDLDRGPLLRIVLVALDRDRALLLVAMHHIISDGWSMGRFVEEMAAAYQAVHSGAVLELPPLPIQYADVAAWQRTWAESGQLDAQVAFWKSHLAGAPPLLTLPLDRARPAQPSYRGQTVHFAIESALAARIKQLGHSRQCTPYMTLLAAFAALLYRYSGQDDLPIGSPIANRNRAETEALIGFFVNTLVTRVRVDGASSFLSLLDQVKHTALDAFAHQDAPFSYVVDALNPVRSPSYNPLFQVMFDLQNTPAGSLEIPGLRLEPLLLDDEDEGTAMFDLSWTMQEQPDGFTGQVEYALDLFEPATIERFITSFRCLLEDIAGAPERSVDALSLLPDDERAHMLALGAAPSNDAPVLCMHHAVAAQARRQPTATAVVWDGASLSYGELDARANQLAHHLRTLGVDRGSLVGVCIDRSLAQIIAVLGVLKAGAAFVPMDPAYPAERLAFMQRDAGLALVLAQADTVDYVPEGQVRVLIWEHLSIELDKLSALPPEVPSRLDDAAYVIYTSGSTGTPKGVVVEHGPWMQTYRAWEHAYRLGDEVRAHLQMAAFSFDVCAGDLVRGLCSGGKLVLCPRDFLLSPADLYALMVRERVECAEFVPAVLRELASYVESIGRDLSFMRVLIAGSDVWYGEEYERFRALCGSETRLINSYGVTEAVIDSTYFEAPSVRLEPERHVPIGRPFWDTRIYILDGCGVPVPIGVAGELYLAGPRLARGYWQRAELTNERFLPDPFSGVAGARMYRTGDAARFLRTGDIEFLGRLDTQIKVRGHRIELGEIETALDKHPYVRNAVVAAHAERPGHNVLVAYIVLSSVLSADNESNQEDTAAAPALDEIRAALSEHLPAYMVPGVFVRMDALPLTPNGKVDRRALPAPTAAPTAEVEEPPVGAREQTIADIWQQLLRVPVGRSSNFFALGGDSILAIQVVSRARAAGLQLVPRLLFQHQTVAALASACAELDGSAEAHAPSFDPATLVGEVPLTPVQSWFAALRAPEPHHYNQSVLLEVSEIEPARLEQALQQLLALHPVLRLRWPGVEDGAPQVYGPPASETRIPLVHETCPEGEPWAVFLERVGQTLQSGLHLADGPLFRSALLCDQSRARLLLVAHHCIIDGVSWRILLEDLAMLLLGQAPMPATTPYSIWAEHLCERAESAEVLAELPLWQRVVGNAPAFPLDHADVGSCENTSGNARTVSVSLDEAITSALLTEVHGAYRTRIDDLLLTALALVLAREWDLRDLLLEREAHGRPDDGGYDLSRSVGWFTSVFPVRLALPVEAFDGLHAGSDDVWSPAALSAAIKAIKEQLRVVPEGGLSYGILRYLHPDAAVRDSVTPVQPAALAFNYMGQVDAASRIGPLQGLASESAGTELASTLPRSYAIEINAHISGGRLVATWEYAPALHDKERIEKLADGFRCALVALVEHCRQPEHGGLSPSDVIGGALSQNNIDHLIEQVAAGHALAPNRAVDEIYPLAPMQAGMLYHSLLSPELGFYVEQLRCTLRGRFRPALFERAWQLLCERHSVLRTAFFHDELPEPMQVVMSRVQVPARIEDWRERSPADKERALDALADEERARGFSLTRAPLFRWALIQLDDERHHFIWTHHHLLVDGWSLPLLFQELFTICAALHRDERPALPPAQSYGRYIAWLQEQDQARARDFWAAQLGDFDTPTPLPGDRSGHGRSGAELGVLHRQLTPALTRRLEASARSERLTLSTFAQAAWALLLAHYSGQDDILFGATVAGRPADLVGAEEMVGLFINTLPVRVHFAADSALRPWLVEIQDRQQEMGAYAYTPLVEIQATSGVASGSPLFESLLVFENYPLGGDDEPSSLLRIEDVRAAEHTNYPLTLVVAPGESLELGMNYDPARFSEAFIAHLLDRLLDHIARLAEMPETLGDIARIDASEAERVLEHWNQTARETPAVCLHQAIAEQARRTPAAIAIAADDATWTYAELIERASHMAAALRAQGVGPDALVGLYAERSAAMVVAQLAILAAGGAYVPLDPGFPAERLAYMAKDAGLQLLLVIAPAPDGDGDGDGDGDDDARSHLPAALCDGPWTAWTPSALARAAAQQGEPAPAPTPANLAYVIYTSGSTGEPKGIAIEHRTVMNFLCSMRERPGLTADDVLLAVTTLSFDIAVLELYLPLLVGGQVVIASRAQCADADALRALIDRYGITLMQATPATWRLLLASGWSGAPRLRALCGGEPLPADLADALLDRVDQLWNMYGPTETTVWSTIAPITVETRRSSSAIAVGRPIANTRVYVLDSVQRPVPVGAIGELYIGGHGLARGYHARPELTSERFVADPFAVEPGARMYRTGDLARFHLDGNLECLGRIDQQVKVRGHRIELGEIEAVLRAHDGVAQAVVVVREDVSGDARLVAYVVSLSDGDIALADELQARCAAKLPPYMLPSAIVMLAQMPLTPNGKLDRNALPRPQRNVSSAATAAPRDALELRLANIWRQVLNIDAVGIHDDFFALGGHSLDAVRLIARLQSVRPGGVPLATLYRAPTVAALAEIVRSDTSADVASPLAPLTPTGDRLPLFCFPGAGGNVTYLYALARALGADQPFYGVRAIGLEPGETPLRRIEDMADAYLSHLRAVQPVGPYVLAGHSYGADVAWAVAQRLRAADETIAAFFSFDSPAPQERDGRDYADFSGGRWMTTIVTVLEQTFGIELSCREIDWERLGENAQIAALADSLAAADVLPGGSADMVASFVQVFRSNHESTFSPYPLSGVPVIIVQAADEPIPLDVDGQPCSEPWRELVDWGWSDFTDVPVRTLAVAGDHQSMLQSPQVAAVAAALAPVLDAVHAAVIGRPFAVSKPRASRSRT
ncbi:MAG: non-ribosomal peptide synthetase [Haliangiales bacterium]